MRCTKSRRVCIEAGALKDTGLSIHMENQFASGQAKRPRGPRSSLLIRQPQISLRSRALAYYLNYHVDVVSPRSGTRKFPGCLPGCIAVWTSSPRTSGMVDLAISAVALAVFWRTHKRLDIGKLARDEYQQLLPVTRHQLAQVIRPTQVYYEDLIDANLLTIMLMDRFECTMHCPFNCILGGKDGHMERGWVHQDGALALLETWATHKKRGSASYIVQECRRALIRFVFMRNKSLPSWAVDGAHFGETGWKLEFDRIWVKLVSLSHLCRTPEGLFREFQIAELDDLIERAQGYDKALCDWVSQLPSEWFYQVHTLEGDAYLEDPHFYSGRVLSFAEPQHAYEWNLYFTGRALGNDLLIELLRQRIKHTPEECSLRGIYQSCLEQSCLQLHAMVENLIASVPCGIGRVDTHHPQRGDCGQRTVTLALKPEIKPNRTINLLWPLPITVKMENVRPEQKAWIRGEIVRIGGILGDGVLQTKFGLQDR